jgi:hypothetical protein
MSVKIIIIISLFLLFFCHISLHAATYTADTTNYLTLRDGLNAGDTLLLKQGNYLNGLRISNLNGTSEKWIVIKSQIPHQAVLVARDGSNTMDITNSSYISVEGFTFDGQNLEGIDAVKASGTANNWSHHIRIYDNIITKHDANQQTCGISTKITCWDWTISHNKIMSAGTGIYLGNSDGTMPFIRGIIEYNFVLNPVGYCMQIKHQIDRPDLPGIPTTKSSTIVRNNVFAKNDRPSPDGDRPNLLFDGQPLSGAGIDDRVECYGNFLYNNPRESLLQATGNVSVHDNIFVSSAYSAMTFQSHNSRNPKELFIYNNSIYDAGTGIRISNPILNYKQIVAGNAVFADIPITGVVPGDNLTDSINMASSFFNKPDTNIEAMNFYPKTGFPKANVDYQFFMIKDSDYNKDFNGNPQDGTYYGAYQGEGTNPGWKLALDIKGSGITSVKEFPQKEIIDLSINPNPAIFSSNISFINPMFTHVQLDVYNIFGIKLSSPIDKIMEPGNHSVMLDVKSLENGIYFIVLYTGPYIETKKMLIAK